MSHGDPDTRDWPRGSEPCPDCEVAVGQRHMRFCPRHPGVWHGDTRREKRPG